MNPKILIISFFLFFGFYSCKKDSATNNNQNQLVIIFKDTPDQKWFVFPSGTKGFNLSDDFITYINKQNIQVGYTPIGKSDTLVIKTNKKHHEIYHKYKGIESVYFLFSVNDTVVITYDKNSYPIAQSLTSDKLTQQYNFRYKQKDKNAKWNLDSYTIIQFDYFSMLFNTKNNRPKIYNTILKRYHVDFVDLDSVKQSFYAYTKKYHKSLDSLYKAKQISDVYYNYYNYQLKLNKATCKINSYKNNSVDLNKIKQTYTSLFNDSLINRVSYQQFAEKIIPDFFETKKHVDLIETENSCFFDSRQTFDLIANASFPPKTKSCLLFSSTKRIIENFSGNDIQEYLHKYISATNDTISYNCLINENNLDFKSIDKLVLSDTSNMQITFGELLKKHKGKVLYIDFWASWCAPCRASMKSAKVLRQKLQDKNIVFIYLAKNDEKQNWKQAIDKLEIDYLGINYFIENSKTSEILKKLKVTSIPRYMIFDKSGELAYSNAPNPENPEIEDLLLSYINL